MAGFNFRLNINRQCVLKGRDDLLHLADRLFSYAVGLSPTGLISGTVAASLYLATALAHALMAGS